MKPTLQLQPITKDLSRILHKFEQGIPLLCDELNFLSNHEKILSSHGLDPAIKYYLNYLHEHPKQKLNFRLPHKVMNESILHQVQGAIQHLLKDNLSQLSLKMSPTEFMKFKHIGYKEMHFWTTRQLLMGVQFPFLGVPRFLYVQWRKLFGIVQLTFNADGKELDGDILVFFENIGSRNLYQCIADYTKKYENELKEQQKLAVVQHNVEEQIIQSHYQFTPGKPVRNEEDKN